MEEEDFVPLKELLLEDNEEINKIKSLYKKEYEYVDFLGPIESLIAHYYYYGNPKFKDKDLIKVLRNIRANYDKSPEYFKEELEREIMLASSECLQKRRITRHELFLVYGYILWCIDNRRIMGDPRGYLNWVANFFGLLNKKERKVFEQFYDEFGDSKEKIESMKGNDSSYVPGADDEAFSKKDSEKFAEYSEDEDSLWSEGSYIKPIDKNDPDFEEKRKYFDESNDKEKNYNCKKCNKAIGKHNLYWHEGMCNDCFFDKYGM